MTSSVIDQAVGTIPVLWMDDQIGTIRNYSELIAREGSPLQIDCAGTIEEARAKWRDYGAIVIDCEMDPHNAAANGTGLLREINKDCKWFPTFIYSGFTDDPRFAETIRKSYALEVVSRSVSFERPISKHPFFVGLRREAEAFLGLQSLHPEEVPFKSYIAAPQRWRREVECHWRKHHNWILREMEWRRWAWSVTCGETLAMGSADLLAFPSEEALREVGENYDRIPFAYSWATPIEEGKAAPPWADTVFKDDYYPTLHISIDGKECEADFDTGAFQSYASDVIVKRTPLAFWAETGGQSQHLGEAYQYFTKRLSVRLNGENGLSATEDLVVNVVKKWDESPFIAVNPKRQVLIGRDVLRAFRVAITLDAIDRKTRVDCRQR